VSTSWLVTGGAGQVGTELRTALARRPGDEVLAPPRAVLDLSSEDSVRTTVRTWLAGARRDGRSAVLVNAGAWTAVDDAEADEERALLVNGAAPGWLAEELAGHGRLLHVSTDYVFAGTADRPYREDDPTGPTTAYGRTKLAGERAVAAAGGDALVVRTAWVYAGHGRNFVRTMLRLAAGDGEVRVVDDQTGSPTWARNLAEGLVAAASVPVRGVLHAVNAGATTWCGLARRVFELAGADPARVVPSTTGEVPRPAPRPAWSVLDTSAWVAAGLPALPPWDDALRRCLADVRPDQPRA
jgi:dTDP-4-dehydrorhamnose reductase